MFKIKRYGLAVLFISLCLNLNSQIKFGVKGGVNFANWHISDESLQSGDEIGYITGISIGGALEVELSENFSIQPEFLYHQKGTSLAFDFFGSTIEAEIKVNYFEVPVLLKASFSNNEKANVFALVGPSLGYALNGTVSEGDQSEDIDFDELEYDRLDLSIAAGLGASFKLEKGELVFDVRYLMGLKNLNKSEDTNISKNRGIGMSIGYFFNLPSSK